MIRLKAITKNNFQECIYLDIEEDQKKFVAPNIYSIAGAYIALTNKDFIPMIYAIYYEDIMVGFIAMSYELEDGVYFYDIYRFMIDKRYQSKGYGKEALQKALEIIKTYPHGKASVVKVIMLHRN